MYDDGVPNGERRDSSFFFVDAFVIAVLYILAFGLGST
jgi:hypothetical protein